MRESVVKVCSCGAEHTAHSWAALELVGRQFVPADSEGPAETIELRNCYCNSTIAVEVPDAS